MSLAEYQINLIDLNFHLQKNLEVFEENSADKIWSNKDIQVKVPCPVPDRVKTIKYFDVPTWFDNVPPGLIPRYHSPPPTVWKASLLRGGSGYFLPRMQRIAFGFRAVKPSSRTLSRSSSALWHVEYHYCSIDCEVFNKGSPNIQIMQFSIHNSGMYLQGRPVRPWSHLNFQIP